MKKIIVALLFTGICFTGFSQSEKYVKAMEALVPAVDTTQSVAGLTELANKFERIAEAEKNQWMPYYYAALTTVTRGYMSMNTEGGMGGNASETDPFAEKADVLIKKAEALSKDNSEIWAVKKMISSLRMIGDPMSRWQTDGAAATTALNKAKQLNPDNPRVYILEAQDKMYTPEEYGGSKTEAKKLFETALKKFDIHKAESSIAPNWGKAQVQYFLTQL